MRFSESYALPVLDIVPLDNFNSDIDEMQFDGVSLRRILDEETEFFLQGAREQRLIKNNIKVLG